FTVCTLLILGLLLICYIPQCWTQSSTEATASSSPKSTAEYDFTGKYRMTSSRSYDELLKTLGVGYFKRLSASKASPEFVITRNEAEDSYTVRILNPFARTSFTFRNNTEFTGIT